VRGGCPSGNAEGLCQDPALFNLTESANNKGPCVCGPGFTGDDCSELHGGAWFRPVCDMYGQCVCAASGTPCHNNGN